MGLHTENTSACRRVYAQPIAQQKEDARAHHMAHIVLFCLYSKRGNQLMFCVIFIIKKSVLTAIHMIRKSSHKT